MRGTDGAAGGVMLASRSSSTKNATNMFIPDNIRSTSYYHISLYLS